MIELTPEQAQALSLAGDTPPTVIDPATRQVYTLVATEPPQDTPRETAVAPWRYLVLRKHPWRKQLSLKGRNMTVRQLVGGIKANKFTDEQAAENYDLPVEAIREALAYAEQHAALLDLEAAYERYRLEQRGERRGPESLPG